MTAKPTTVASLTLDEVLDEIAGLTAPPVGDELRAWTARYPQYAHAIVAFVTDWATIEDADAEHHPTTEDVQLVVNRTMSCVQALLDDADSEKPLNDLDGAIMAAGYDYDSFQHIVGIDRSILDSLIARLAKPTSLPLLLVSKIARALRQPDDRLRQYFMRPPQMATAYKARGRPSFNQIEFAELIRHSSLPEPDKHRWLSEPLDPGLRN